MVDALRRPGRAPLEDGDLRGIFSWIPPRTVERFTIESCLDGRSARGIYVETFIPPDGLGPSCIGTNLAKVDGAIRCAAREGARLASLGGFTSIVAERTKRRQRTEEDIALTTGNTLTAAFIIRGIERAANRVGIALSGATMLVLGSTGDVGSACVSHFARRVERLVLCARRRIPLREQARALAGSRAGVDVGTDLVRALAQADVVIAAASLVAPTLASSSCKPGALVCDAGYPKNLAPASADQSLHVFWGGMGQARIPWKSDGTVGDSFYRFPAPGIAHGCMMEAMVLALEGRFEPFSKGRGNITEAAMDEILEIAERHGIGPAPLFNSDGLWPGEVA